jgi:hypothetical protein
MRVQMLNDVLGTHYNNPNGSARGDVLDVDENTGRKYVENGYAVPVVGNPVALCDLPKPYRPGGVS